MIDDWGNDFIPPELRDNIVCLDEPDHHEHQGYTVSLETGNYENDFQAAQDSALDSSGDGPLITGSIAADINGAPFLDPDIQTAPPQLTEQCPLIRAQNILER